MKFQKEIEVLNKGMLESLSSEFRYSVPRADIGSKLQDYNFYYLYAHYLIKFYESKDKIYFLFKARPDRVASGIERKLKKRFSNSEKKLRKKFSDRQISRSRYFKKRKIIPNEDSLEVLCNIKKKYKKERLYHQLSENIIYPTMRAVYNAMLRKN